jgi:hypothetical protein
VASAVQFFQSRTSAARHALRAGGRARNAAVVLRTVDAPTLVTADAGGSRRHAAAATTAATLTVSGDLSVAADGAVTESLRYGRSRLPVEGSILQTSPFDGAVNPALTIGPQRLNGGPPLAARKATAS